MGVVFTVMFVLLSPVLLPILLIENPEVFIQAIQILPQAIFILIAAPFMSGLALIGSLFYPLFEGIMNIIQHFHF